jgi:hypothetical protein
MEQAQDPANMMPSPRLLTENDVPFSASKSGGATSRCAYDRRATCWEQRAIQGSGRVTAIPEVT